MLSAGVLLAAVEGSARIGAGVGVVILVSAAFAVATVMLLEGAVTRRRALIVLISPIAGLVALAALDLATAHGSGHYTGSILHARSAGDLRDVIVRRYKAAWGELHNHAMPVATAFALLCAALGLRRHGRLLSPVAQDPVWQAAFAGGLTAGVVGALVEDSGPVLLVVAVFALGCVASYLWGRPAQPTGERAHPGLRTTDAPQSMLTGSTGAGSTSISSASPGTFAPRQGRPYASHIPPAANNMTHKSQPRAVVPTPTYFRPEAATTNVITGLT
jgi:hypothetical protein